MASCGATVATSPAHCCHGIVLWKKKHSLEFLRKTEGLEQSSTRLTTAQRLTGLGRRRRGCTLLIFAIEFDCSERKKCPITLFLSLRNGTSTRWFDESPLFFQILRFRKNLSRGDFLHFSIEAHCCKQF
ncbi:unnamed protein product [Acanthoscelides obtectus]|uniref:Uncharacterized protein n=1 Tax=Acanthoscelides obtectus TaxID=200917 RepID=A0A9P0KDV5_ACAOB|nr:unnamed protein product [Acanthoscelides obtectus]CAK1656431.1 hypothetical protein AOBTE_LOCUS19706 [Acanthoscelides obtectus]